MRSQNNDYTDTKTRHQHNIYQICYKFLIFTPSTRDYHDFAYLVNRSNEVSITFFTWYRKWKNNCWVLIIRVNLRNKTHQLVTGILYVSKSRASQSFNMMLENIPVTWKWIAILILEHSRSIIGIIYTVRNCNTK